jgi:hypothetical protein
MSGGRIGRSAFLTVVLTLLVAVPAATAAAPATKPHRASVQLTLPGAFSVSGQPVTVPQRSVGLRGVVRPYEAGQIVTLRAYLGRQLIKRDRLAVHRSPGGTYGWFTDSVSSPGVGQVQISVQHAKSSALASFTATASFAALDDAVSFGSTGRFVVLLQQRLAALHFYIPQTGVYDAGTGWALDAYHRLLHWGTYQTLDRNTVIWLLNGWGAFPVRYRGDGRHAEGNLGLQLLALIDHGHVQSIYPISSGKPSTPTVLGRFHVYRKSPGYLPDGMYFSSFFYTGYAIHGYNPAPDYPASHGCMRVPIPDAISIYDWLGMGDGVDVYY